MLDLKLMAQLVDDALALETPESLEAFLLEHSTESYSEMESPMGQTVAFKSWNTSFKSGKVGARINCGTPCEATVGESSFFRAAA